MKPIALLAFFLLVFAQTTAAQTPAAPAVDCASCHEDQGTRLKASRHSGLTCLQCHAGTAEFPHSDPVTKTPCQSCHAAEHQDFAQGAHGHAAAAGKTNAPSCASCHRDVHDTAATRTLLDPEHLESTCGTCHTEISRQFLASVHGAARQQNNPDAPNCTTCHGAHTNRGFAATEGAVSGVQVRDTCAECHADVRLAQRNRLPLDRLTSFDRSFHGLTARAGSVAAANCASCHGVHNILPSTDPKSTIHAANLQRTCGQCHPGASQEFSAARTHWQEGDGEPMPVRWVRQIYLVLIPLVVGLMTVHNLGDFLRKWLGLVRNRLQPAVAPAWRGVRMLPAERGLHALLAISFVILVWSGFALRYPDLWISKPLLAGESRWPVRGILHRGAAVVLVLVSVAHIFSLARSRRLREHWQELWPSWQDVNDGLRMFGYNLGLRRHRPVLPSHSYIEKVEYWAVVWGTLIMALTGFLLWANRFTFAWLPRPWLDAAAALHFFEAVLASLAILVWHFYFVIFDPEVYPVDSAWLNGTSSRRPLAPPPAPGSPQPDPQSGSAAR